MKTRTPHEKGAGLAIGYIRVSTHEQAQEGVSLDVQRDKLRAYCKLHDVKLVDVKADEGISGGMMLNLATYAQFERAIIRERTQEAITHLKAQGVRLGCPPYGYRYSHEVDAQGRRILVKDAEHMQVLEQIIALHSDGLSINGIVERLTTERHVPQRAVAWHAATVRSLLRRPAAAASKSAAEVARDLRDGGQSFRQIGRVLSEQGYTPLRGGRWHPATVMNLLTPS